LTVGALYGSAFAYFFASRYEIGTLFHVTGGYTYVDPYGEALGYEDVFTKLEHAIRHYEAVGLGKEHVRRIVR
jgi:2,4'-dihydroxyacetophenone dioxygenase